MQTITLPRIAAALVEILRGARNPSVETTAESAIPRSSKAFDGKDIYGAVGMGDRVHSNYFAYYHSFHYLAMLDQLHSVTTTVLPVTASMWLLHFLNGITGDRLIWSGALKPRRIGSIFNILTAPFLHVDTGHLKANTGAFVVLGLLLSILGKEMFLVVSVALILITGIGLWLFSTKPVIGASGVIFGYLGYLLSFGMTVDGGLPLLAGAIGFVTCGGIWVGIFPNDPRVSWQAHAIGFTSGLILGHYLGLRAIGLGVYG